MFQLSERGRRRRNFRFTWTGLCSASIESARRVRRISCFCCICASFHPAWHNKKREMHGALRGDWLDPLRLNFQDGGPRIQKPRMGEPLIAPSLFPPSNQSIVIENAPECDLIGISRSERASWQMNAQGVLIVFGEVERFTLSARVLLALRRHNIITRWVKNTSLPLGEKCTSWLQNILKTHILSE